MTSNNINYEIPGLSVKRNKNGFVAARLHYSVVPKFASPEWKQHAMKGYSKDRWEQEMEINFTLAGSYKVYPSFSYEKHVRKLSAIKELPLIVGWDYGYHHPAIVIAQIDTFDCLCVLDEILGNDITIRNFTKDVKGYLQENYPTHYNAKNIQHFGDPAGNQQNDKSEFTSIQIQRTMGIFVRWKRASIKQGIRVIQQLMEDRPDGSTSFKVDPKCRILIDGFNGGYSEDTPTNEKESKEVPFADDYYTHNQDCLRYIVINKFPAHGILFKTKNARLARDRQSPISDERDYEDKYHKVTGY